MSIVDERAVLKLRTSYQSIVVAVDGTPRSRQVVTAAARLAKDACAALTIVGAYARNGSTPSAMAADLLRADAYSASPASGMDELLGDATIQARSAGAPLVHRRSVSGAPVDVLLAAAANAGADLIVIGERMFDTPWGRFFGSFPAEVARRSTADVLIVNGARA
ncbi:universal stress protein [Nocardia sp. NPDC003693]